MWLKVRPIHCQHIADYYDYLWSANHQLGTNLLRHGYGQQAKGRIEVPVNNLYKHKNFKVCD